MIKIHFFSTFFLFLITYGQNIEKLDKNYFVDLAQLEKGIPIIEIKKTELNTTSLNKNNNLTKGQYLLENNTQKLLFNLNENGDFIKSATGEFKDIEGMKISYWSFLFENGKVKEIDIKTDTIHQPITTIKANDSIFVLENFDMNNYKLKRKIIIKNEGGFDNSIEFEYFDNGNTKYEFNKIKNITKEYYNNGNLKHYFNKKTTEEVSYDENGIKTHHYYHMKEGGWCDEYFENGIIVKKDCKNTDNSQRTQYYYKNGKLNSHEVSTSK